MGNGPDVAIGKQEFDEFGNEISLRHVDENGKPTCSNYGICRSKTMYDRFGNLSQRFFLDVDGQPSNHQIAGYHKLEIKWDRSGNHRTSLQYFDVDLIPTLHKTRGYHKVNYKYNNQNQLIRLEYLDTKGQLINRLDNNAAYRIYKYDESGIQSEVLQFDKEGILIH